MLAGLLSGWQAQGSEEPGQGYRLLTGLYHRRVGNLVPPMVLDRHRTGSGLYGEPVETVSAAGGFPEQKQFVFVNLVLLGDCPPELFASIGQACGRRWCLWGLLGFRCRHVIYLRLVRIG